MVTREEAITSGKPFRVKWDVAAKTETIEYLSAKEISDKQAKADAIAAAEAARAPTRDEAIDALLAKEAGLPTGDATVKAYIGGR